MMALGVNGRCVERQFRQHTYMYVRMQLGPYRYISLFWRPLLALGVWSGEGGTGTGASGGRHAPRPWASMLGLVHCTCMYVCLVCRTCSAEVLLGQQDFSDATRVSRKQKQCMCNNYSHDVESPTPALGLICQTTGGKDTSTIGSRAACSCGYGDSWQSFLLSMLGWLGFNLCIFVLLLVEARFPVFWLTPVEARSAHIH